jgi:hypothetical protein
MVPKDSFRLWKRAACSSGSCQSDSVGSLHHHWRLNPCRRLFERLPLNEIAIAIARGSSDQAR